MKHIICTVSNDLSFDQRMIRICSTLKSAGYEVTLVGRGKSNSRPLKAYNFKQKRLKLFFEKGKLFYLELNIRLFFFLLFKKVDLINSVDLDTILPGVLVARLKGIPSTYDAHEYFTELPEVVGRPLIQKIWQSIGNTCIPRVSAAYTVGPELQRIFTSNYQLPFELVRNVPFSYDRDRSTSIANTPKIIFYQGVLNEGRGLEQAIEAMNHVENAELHIAGEGDKSNELRALTRAHHMENKVKFLGWLSPNELKSYNTRAYIGLNLLEQKGLNYYYSLANKTFDYIQAEIPAIHMDFPEYENLKNEFHCFITIKSLQPSSIALAINKLLKDEQLYETLKLNCQKARLILNWENEQSSLLSIYQKLLK